MKAMYSVSGEVFFTDKCLPFRANISCSHFQRFLNAPRHNTEYKAVSERHLTNYLDD